MKTSNTNRDLWQIIAIGCVLSTIFMLVVTYLALARIDSLHRQLDDERAHPAVSYQLRPCATDEGVGGPCIWRAGQRGNERGRSFVVDETDRMFVPKRTYSNLQRWTCVSTPAVCKAKPAPAAPLPTDPLKY